MSDVTAVPLRPVGKGGIAALWTGVALLIGVGLGGAIYASGPARVGALPPAEFLAVNGKRHGVVTTPSGLEYQVLEKGAGPTPGVNDVVRVDYVGRLTNGTEFDASKPGQPVAMPVARVVPGFSEALRLMPKGSKFRFWLPPQLGYGDQDNGPIPANSVLVFEVTMVDFMTIPPGMQVTGM